ncbi:hypothetical protein BS78_K216700 [Paspalum vaginatum]|uniref:Glabrous enhancer-binding protein-like DBD domain-containing protein n=1 Tax=Paspalum vaginatum TaxID=158149 RepID=A0A9W7X7W8_9POAL|nr:hypothetical protein BS78_K216700 [Paspalum vaginatum]
MASSRGAASSSNSNIMPDRSSNDEMGRKRRPSSYTRWPYNDEALILRALVAGRRRYGQPPQLAVLYDALLPRFERKDVTDADLSKKISNLQEKYWKAVNSHKPLKTIRERKLQRLSAKVWGHDDGNDSDGDYFDL